MLFYGEKILYFTLLNAVIRKQLNMDSIDRKILAELQVDGRLTLSELADRVGLSVSPCHRRVKELEKTKAIVGYRTEISQKK